MSDMERLVRRLHDEKAAERLSRNLQLDGQRKALREADAARVEKLVPMIQAWLRLMREADYPGIEIIRVQYQSGTRTKRTGLFGETKTPIFTEREAPGWIIGRCIQRDSDYNEKRFYISLLTNGVVLADTVGHSAYPAFYDTPYVFGSYGDPLGEDVDPHRNNQLKYNNNDIGYASIGIRDAEVSIPDTLKRIAVENEVYWQWPTATE